ncbi:hypothetical protein [Oscillatoria nigro-viridis]|uniref:hypothetical protein n=1 Tax=Phormidium nigroviride TaxID=482564 RepID=UPI0002DCD246|nr:hypothetical protein [Oscillatoria nigro-viridis]
MNRDYSRFDSLTSIVAGTVAESCHNSCLVLISWEKPIEIAALESQPKTCQTLQLNS